MKTDETDELEKAKIWIGEGHSVALGTVVSTWGSAPRQAGSQIVVRSDGVFAGSVSGGCAEGTVIEAALAAIGDGKFRRLEFGVQDAQAWSVGLACGGKIEVFVEPITSARSRNTLLALNEARSFRRVVVRAIDLDTGEDRLIEPDADSSPLGLAAATAARVDRSAILDVEGRRWFLAVYSPPIDLAIVGAVHIAQALCKLGTLVGHRVRVIDPRASFATAERFPGVTLSHEYPDEALARAPLGRRSALVALSHDPKIDDPALVTALESTAFYIGALGSRKNQMARIERLKAHGFNNEQLARIHGPVGLAIGARTPEEIAVSIVAQITEVLRRPG